MLLPKTTYNLMSPIFTKYIKNHDFIFQSAGGGQGFDSRPLGVIMDIPIDTPLLCGGVSFFYRAW